MDDIYLQINTSCNRLVDLLEEGVDINVEDTTGLTVLRGLIMNNDLPQIHKYILCELMLKFGADPNTKKGLSPLMTAVIMGDMKIVELLVNHGADVNYEIGIAGSPLFVMNKDTALSLAINANIGDNEEIAMYLINSRKIKQHLLFRSCMKNTKYLRYILDKKMFDLNSIKEFHPKIEQK
jgi:ankyrin repeat protein